MQVNGRRHRVLRAGLRQARMRANDHDQVLVRVVGAMTETLQAPLEAQLQGSHVYTRST